MRQAIGAAPAAELTAAGHEVVATARDLSLLESVAASLRLALDVTDQDSVNQAIAAAGPLDAVVNNAATDGSGPLEDYPLDRIRDMFETNTLGALRVIQALVPGWRQRRSGVIINVSSVQGQVASPLEGPYSASKFALEAFSESLHYELRHFGIRTVIIQPGYIAPGMKPTNGHRGHPDYDELHRQWAGTDTKVVGERPVPTLSPKRSAQRSSTTRRRCASRSAKMPS